MGVGLVALSLSRHVGLATVPMLAVGFGVVVTTASINTVLQTVVDEEMRGRVMSLFMMAFVGASPLGSLLGGALAERIGVSVTLGLAGGVIVLLALGFATRIAGIRAAVRPIYVRKGIIREVASGLQTATELRPRP
jgi:MFS family permease